jgi:hypothetical protein
VFAKAIPGSNDATVVTVTATATAEQR